QGTRPKTWMDLETAYRVPRHDLSKEVRPTAARAETGLSAELLVRRRIRRIAIGLSSLTVLALLMGASLPAAAQTSGPSSPCPVLTLDNPSPGDAVPSGHYVVSGAARVPGSGDTSSGVSRIDFFLGTRDAGGPIVGSAMTGTGVGGGVGSFQAVVF